jgi:aldose 1-epimerase
MQTRDKSGLGEAEAQIFTIAAQCGTGIEVTLSNWGASILKILAPDREGNFEDVVQGPDGLAGLRDDASYMGRSVGRFANRIAHGRFTLGETEYQLAQNNGPNHLHGGLGGIHNEVWDVVEQSDTKIVFALVCADGSDGYPGELTISVRYEVTEAMRIEVEYSATTTKKTPVNIVQHVYWNLTGDPAESALNHTLESMKAAHYLPVDADSIPLGEIASVRETPFDFSFPKPLSVGVNSGDVQIERAYGYDHCLVFSDKVEHEALNSLTLTDPKSGRSLCMSTNMPGVQLYSGNFLDGTTTGKGNQAIHARSGVCMETQHFPDSPNQKQFPSPMLDVGETYQHSICYDFGVS